MYSYEFKGRKPSANQVYSMVMHAAKSGHEKIEIRWGENAIDLEYFHGNWHGPKYAKGKWFGAGWIKDIDGQNMAWILDTSLPQSIEEFPRKFA